MVSSEAEQDSFEREDVKGRASDEDTEDASETEVEKKGAEFTGIRDQMYQDQRAQILRQQQQLRDRTMPLCVKRFKKLAQVKAERIRTAEIWGERQRRVIASDCIAEKAANLKEFEEKTIELRESLLSEWELKKKMIEEERSVMELTGDTMAVKPVTTRKLRRRPNDPAPIPEKRAKPSPVQLSGSLDDNEIGDDLLLISRVTGAKAPSKPTTAGAHAGGQGAPHPQGAGEVTHEASVEDGRLLYDKRWFNKDQSVIVESKEQGKINAIITAIGSDDIVFKKTADNAKLRISVVHLQTGHYTLRRRAT